jgi:hypothetical protein
MAKIMCRKRDTVYCPKCNRNLLKLTRDVFQGEAILASQFEGIGDQPNPQTGDVLICRKCNTEVDINKIPSYIRPGTPIKEHLRLEVDYPGAVPRVFLDGVEVKGKVSVSFDWETANSEYKSTQRFAIAHYVTTDKGVFLKKISYENEDE